VDYDIFCNVLNKHLFEGQKEKLLKNLADHPERFLGLFHPTKPHAKLLQNLLQSQEIKFGDALEEIIRLIIADMNFTNLPLSITDDNHESLSLDQYFTDGNRYFFIEQKIRDDHDSTKKRGQIQNFHRKLSLLKKTHDNLTGIMYFIDSDLEKNKNYYEHELVVMNKQMGVEVLQFYGKELFVFFNNIEAWDNLIEWLNLWKSDLPDFPELNFDLSPNDSFNEIKNLGGRYWEKIISNDIFWQEGIIKVLFKTGETLELLKKYYWDINSPHSKRMASLLSTRIEKLYQ